MANTYTQIHIHAIFAVKGRSNLISHKWKDDLYKYIAGIIDQQKHRLLIINGMPDHVHLFFGMNPAQSLSDLMQDVKGSSSKWINEKKFLKSKFEWQQGYGAFSYSKSQVEQVVNYIKDQEEHHKKFSFQDEYKIVLNKFGVKYNEQYIFTDTSTEG
jgi:putative transposase